MSEFKQGHERREEIAALVLGELDPTTAEQLKQHIDNCELCRGFRDALAEQEETLRSTFDVIARGVGRVEHLAERLGESPDQPETQAASPLGRLIGAIRTMRPSRKILAVAAAIVLTFTGLASWLIPGRSSAGIAFANVLDQIRVFRSYSCLCTWEYEGQAPYSYQEMHLSLSRRREVRPEGTILVFDLSQQPNRTLILNPDRRSAVEETLLDTGPRQDPDFLRILAGMRDGNVDDLGVKEVDGRLAHGFHRPDKVNDFTVWADPKTGLPIRIELVQPTVSRRLIMSEFQFDVNFDESLFSTTAPEGYTVRQVEKDGVNPTEQHLVEGLRAIATFLDGRFSVALDEKAIEKAFREHIERTEASPSEEEMKALQLKVRRALRYVQILEHFHKVSDLSYAGDGVTLGDAATPVLWWKPKASEIYRVVYADLSIRDVRAEDLSNVPKK